ncbi:MAG: class I SAM-dependent methyltransferase [Saccharofermentanales bacterium]
MKTDIIKKLSNALAIIGSTLDPDSPGQISDIIIQSGKNKYLPRIDSSIISGEMIYIIQFPGNQLRSGLKMILPMLADELGKYDSASVTFLSKGEKTSVEAGEREVRIMKARDIPDEEPVAEASGHMEHGVSTNRDYFIKIAQASGLLREIGILDEKMKVRNDMIRKYNQIDRFVEFADAVIAKIGVGSVKKSGQSGISVKSGEGRRPAVNILDCACGKSYLSFVMYFYIKEVLKLDCTVTGLDISDNVIEASRRTASSLGYTGMKFIAADLRGYHHQGPPPDLCISLHACDAATDYAIYAGIMNEARAILCVPCCHKELLSSDYKVPELSQSIFRNGVFKTRFSDIMTDAIRVLTLEEYGYDVSVAEYISPLDSPKNLLISAVYTGRRNKASAAELAKLSERYGMEITLGKLLKKESGS